MRLIRLSGVLWILGECGVGVAAPVQWPSASGGNDHFYEFVFNPSIKWTDAKLAAQTRTFAGVPGHLPAITSAAESAFLAANFPDQGGSSQNGWLGGFQDRSAPDYSEPAGGWRWVTGEPFAYLNWFNLNPMQPDNAGGSQDYIRANVSFKWDDFQNDPANPSIQHISGYFVEYAVPEPSSGALITLTSGFIARRRMRLLPAR